MNSPYKYKLEKLEGTQAGKQVTIHRADAPDVKGELVEVDEYGCSLKQSDGEAATTTFVAFEHIRGVASVDWDLEALAH